MAEEDADIAVILFPPPINFKKLHSFFDFEIEFFLLKFNLQMCDRNLGIFKAILLMTELYNIQNDTLLSMYIISRFVS